MTPSTIRIPTSILSDCRFAAAPYIDGIDPRPSGSGLTGADIAILWLVLDVAANANEHGTVFIPQIRFRKLLGKADPVRISAALTRLEGTNMLHGYGLYPAVRSHAHLGKGSREPRWAVELHPRMIELVRKHKEVGKLTELNTLAFRKLTSRLSMVLWCRWMSILDGVYPPKQIGLSKDAHSAAMEITVKLDDIPAFLGRREKMMPSEINALVLTASPRSPIAKEMHAAGVAADIVAVKRVGFDDRYGITIQMTTLRHEGLAYLPIAQRHRNLRNEERKGARLKRMQPVTPRVEPSAAGADADR